MRTSLRGLLRFLNLPEEVTPFERAYLARANGIALWVLVAHLPILTAIAWWNGTGPLAAAQLCAVALVGPLLARFALPDRPRLVSVVIGVAAMLVVGVLVHVGQGPMQIEMHFHFFVVLASLAVFGNPRVILVAAATVALHHLALWCLLPASVFNYDAAVSVVAVHALFVVLLSVSGCFLARNFFDNVIGLSRKVERRTHDLEARHRDVRLLLDNIGQGFLTIDASGTLGSERSQVVERWFGPSARVATSWFALLHRLDTDFALRTEIGWEAVVDDFMPLELTLAQMPSRLRVGARHFTVDYRRISGAGADVQALVVVDDVTERVEQEATTRSRAEDLELLKGLVEDRVGTLGFLEDGEATIDALERGRLDPDEVKRAIHTLKGNAGVAGFHAIGKAAHELEQAFLEAGALRDEDLDALARAFRRTAARAAQLGGEARGMLEVDPERLAALEAAVRSDAPAAVIAERLGDLRREPARHRLTRLAEHAQRIAASLEKGQVDVDVDDAGVMVEPERWAPIWACLVHAVRNAVDHGVEAPEIRAEAGKKPRGLLVLRASDDGRRVLLEVEDDGRGIDLDALAARAEAAGLPASTEAEIMEALWVDGVSTASRVTEISGRGVGMSALRAAVHAAGGEVAVVSARGVGTTLRIEVPRVHAASRSGLKSAGGGAVRRIARLEAKLAAGEVR